MKLNLPLRLKTALSFTEGAVLADIGTDHAYLPIAACLTGKAKRAIACDINPGPLAKAEKNIRDFGLLEKIETRLGSGLAPLRPGEADCAVISGMGGMLITEILSANTETARSLKKIILQPQHDCARLRKFLHEASYIIEDEELIFDGGKYYFIICTENPANKGGLEKWSEAEYTYGKFILEKRGAVLEKFLKAEAEKLERYIMNGKEPSLLMRREMNEAARKGEHK